MKKASGIRDVARHAGVSSATVSRVLSGQAAVSEQTQAKVLAAIRDLDFQPNHMAQGLRRGRSTTVALLVGDIEQGVYASLTKHIQPALEGLGLDLLLYNLGHSQERLANILARTEAMRLHGIILAASDMLSTPNIQSLAAKVQEQGLPVIAVGLSLQAHGIPSIVYDDRGATRTSVTYMLETYGGPVAYIGRILGSASGTERFEGYRTALAERGLAVDQRLVWDASFRYRAGWDSVQEALDRGLRFRSIQAASDEMALGAMAALQARGRRIPEDVAVAGIGDIEASAYLCPALTTHGAFPAAVAETIAGLLEDHRRRRPLAAVTTLERSFVRRASA